MSVLGSEYKINIHIEPIDGSHMGDKNFDFEVQVYTHQNKSVTFKKSEMKKVDEDNYIAVVDSEKAIKIGKGKILVRVTAHIPDKDFPDGYRTEIQDVSTNILIS